MGSFQKLSLVQKAMVLGYKHGYTIPFLEDYARVVEKERAKAETQKIFMEAQISLIGNEEERRRYWINRMRA